MVRYATVLKIAPILLGVLLLFLGFLSGPVHAYPTYHDPATDGAGQCASCHFRWPNRADTHDLHVFPLTNNCDNCHTGSGRNNPFTMWSTGSSGDNNNFSCAGCHGRDYSETIELQNGFDNGSNSFNLNGLAKSSGYGLRKQHLIKGVTDCITCHADVPRSFIKPENVAPVYYGRSDVTPSDPCVSSDEDSSPEYAPVVGSPGTDTPADDAVGLDNDGDGRIDQADPDCNPSLVTTPGEAGAPYSAQQLIVTAIDALGNITIDYDPACSATDHSVYVGPLTPAAMQNGNYTQAFCAIASNTFNPGTGDVFFVVVGEEGSSPTNVGSYGESRFPDASDPTYPGLLIHRERPPDTTNLCAGRAQTLTMRCD